MMGCLLNVLGWPLNPWMTGRFRGFAVQKNGSSDRSVRGPINPNPEGS